MAQMVLSSLLANETHTLRSYDAQEQGERPIDPQQQGIIRCADRSTDLAGWHDCNLVNGDLRKFSKPVLLGRFHVEPEQIGVGANSRGQRANHHRGKLGEQIALHHEGGARLPIVARRGDCHKLSPAYYGSGHS